MAGLNPGLFEMANIRNQCSWVHSDDWEGATRKAEDLVRGAVMRAAQLEPVRTVELPVQKAALVVGGGAAGMNAALTLAEQGFPVHLVERTEQSGRRTAARLPMSTNYATPNTQSYLRELIAKVEAHPLIRVHLETELIETGGFQGNFESKLRAKDGIITEITHGAVIVATGSQEYRGPEYGLGSDPRIVTQMDFEALLAEAEDKVTR